MKLSVFKKVALWMLGIILVLEAALFFIMYGVTYNNAVSKAKTSITNAADYAVQQLTFFNPDTFEFESNEESIITSQLESSCNRYDIDKIYLLLPDLKNNTVMYLERGISAKEYAKEETHVIDDLSGDYVNGGMTEEMKDAFEGDRSGITAHIKNEKENMLVCYMPVSSYYWDKNGNSSTKITALVSAEISLQRVTEDINARFREFAFLMVIVTIAVAVLAAVIVYFKVTKPINYISKRMKGFVSEHNTTFEKLPVKGSDELAEMSDSFNTMAQELDLYIDDVAELNRQNAELDIAKKIQLGLLEPQDFLGCNVAIKASMQTAKVVGGDLYDYHILPNGNVFITVADVSGKGITAALFMSRAVTLLNQYAKLGYSPSKILGEYNSSLAEHNPNFMFITTFAAVYNPKTRELIYSNAGHNYPYILSDRLIKLDGKNGMAAGIIKDLTYPEHIIKMKQGDKLFLFTDGVNEAQDAEGRLFGTERLETVLQNHSDSCAEDLVSAVKQEVERFSGGAEQADDITMLALEIKNTEE